MQNAAALHLGPGTLQCPPHSEETSDKTQVAATVIGGCGGCWAGHWADPGPFPRPLTIHPYPPDLGCRLFCLHSIENVHS